MDITGRVIDEAAEHRSNRYAPTVEARELIYTLTGHSHSGSRLGDSSASGVRQVVGSGRAIRPFSLCFRRVHENGADGPRVGPGTTAPPNARFVSPGTLQGPRPRVRASPGVRISGWQRRSEGAAGQNLYPVSRFRTRSASNRRPRSPRGIPSVSDAWRGGGAARRRDAAKDSTGQGAYRVGAPSRQSARPSPKQTASRIRQNGSPVLIAAD